MLNRSAISSLQWSIWLILACAASGCSVPKEARQGAGLIAAYTTAVQKDIDRYSSQQLRIDQARLETLDELERNAKTTAQHTQREMAIWQTREFGTGNKDSRIVLYEYLLTASDLTAQQFREMELRRYKRSDEIKALQSAVNLNSKSLGDIAQALAKLSMEPDKKADFDFLVSYFGAVTKSLEEFRRAAEQEAQCAEAEAKGKGCASKSK